MTSEGKSMKCQCLLTSQNDISNFHNILFSRKGPNSTAFAKFCDVSMNECTSHILTGHLFLLWLTYVIVHRVSVPVHDFPLHKRSLLFVTEGAKPGKGLTNHYNALHGIKPVLVLKIYTVPMLDRTCEILLIPLVTCIENYAIKLLWIY